MTTGVTLRLRGNPRGADYSTVIAGGPSIDTVTEHFYISITIPDGFFNAVSRGSHDDAPNFEVS